MYLGIHLFLFYSISRSNERSCMMSFISQGAFEQTKQAKMTFMNFIYAYIIMSRFVVQHYILFSLIMQIVQQKKEGNKEEDSKAHSFQGKQENLQRKKNNNYQLDRVVRSDCVMYWQSNAFLLCPCFLDTQDIHENTIYKASQPIIHKYMSIYYIVISYSKNIITFVFRGMCFFFISIIIIPQECERTLNRQPNNKLKLGSTDFM